MSIAHYNFITLEFAKDARKGFLKEYRLETPRISAGRSFQIGLLGQAIFIENASVCTGKVYSIIIRSSGEMRVNLRDHFKNNWRMP